MEATAAGPARRQGAPLGNRRQGSALVLVEAESVIVYVWHPSAAHSASVPESRSHSVAARLAAGQHRRDAEVRNASAFPGLRRSGVHTLGG